MKQHFLFLIVCIYVNTILLNGCAPSANAPSITLTPVDNTDKVYDEGNGNFIYFTVTNNAEIDECQIAPESPAGPSTDDPVKNPNNPGNLLILKEMDPVLPGNKLEAGKSVKLKYQIVHWDQSKCTAGVTPCIVYPVRVKAKWLNNESEEKINVVWTKPLKTVTCYLAPTADASNFKSPAGKFTAENVASGMTYKCNQIDEVINPNDFDIWVFIGSTPLHQCVSEGAVYQGEPGSFVNIAAHKSVAYYSKISGIYPGSCLNSDCDLYIYAPSVITPHWVKVQLIVH